jgi:hypothetical protein
MMSLSRKVKRELKRTGLIQEGLKYLEKTELQYILDGKPKKRGLSVRDYGFYFEGKQGEITGKVTVRVCDMFMDWLVFDANEFLKKQDSTMKVISRKLVTTTKNTVEYDVCFEIDGEQVCFEIKFSQNDSAFRGSTHGTNKVDDFIFIGFKFNQDAILKETNYGILGDVWIGTTKEKPKFIGEATNKSSNTIFKYTNKDYSVEDMEDCTIFGSSRLSRVNYQLIGKKLYE